MIKNILINFPTNLGDAILALPALDNVRAAYPKSKITAIVSMRTKSFLLTNNLIDEVAVFDKLWKFRQKLKFCLSLRGKYYMMIDLKNSFLPVILGVKKRTPFFRNSSKKMHLKDAYLKIVSKLTQDNNKAIQGEFILAEDKEKAWEELKLSSSLFIACSSLSDAKRYNYTCLKRLLEYLLLKGYPIVLLGEEKDRGFYKDILSLKGIVDLVGKTTIGDVFYLLKNYARLLVCVDSALLHIGSYLNLPIAALFGPTDEARFGPWPEKFIVLRESASCGDTTAQIAYSGLNIEPKCVMEAVEKLW